MLDEKTARDDGTLKISIQSPETSIISKKFQKSLAIKEISLVGSTKKINYSAARTGIRLLENFLATKNVVKKD